MEDIINSYRDLLSIKLVRKKELSTNAAEKLSSTLVERFSEKAPFTSNPREAAGLLLELITEALPVRAMYFDYQPETEGLSLLCSSQMESHLVDLWASIPFKARATNRLSPFAICINEKRTVVIEDIRIYYALLAGVSVEALEASGGRGFVAHPVLSGEKITGLICLLQHSSSEPFFKDFRKALTTASGYLAYQLENFRAAHQVRDAERIIGRFADPALVRALSNASADDAILAGQSFKGVIIIQDMRGSTKASRRVNDPADLAARLSLIYRKAGTLAQRFGGSFEKGNGDGLITTLGTDEANNGALTLCFLYLNEVFEVARQSLQIQETVVVAHRGFLFKGVMGHLHRIAWDTCGSDLVDAFSIEKAAKQLPGIVLAISSQFVSAEPDPIKTALERYAKFTTTVEGLEGPVFFLDRAGAQLLHSIISASERNAA